MKAAVLEKIKEHGGPVTNSEDIQEIVTRFPNRKMRIKQVHHLESYVQFYDKKSHMQGTIYLII